MPLHIIKLKMLTYVACDSLSFFTGDAWCYCAEDKNTEPLGAAEPPAGLGLRNSLLILNRYGTTNLPSIYIYCLLYIKLFKPLRQVSPKKFWSNLDGARPRLAGLTNHWNILVLTALSSYEFEIVLVVLDGTLEYFLA